MDTIATISLPIFALLLSGNGARRLGLFNEPSIAGLNGFVCSFALPALFIVKVSETPVVRLFDWRLIAACHGAALCVFAVAMLCGWMLFGQRVAVLASGASPCPGGKWAIWARRWSWRRSATGRRCPPP